MLILGAAALVVLFVVLPLLQLGGDGGEGGASPSVAATARPGTVLVPETVGLPTQDAIAAANAAGLDWTVRCDEDLAQPEGIIDQEPPAGTSVAPGSTFTMFSARISDCR
jgi:PASTA domain